MASITASALIGSWITRMQRGSNIGTASANTINIPISPVNVGKTELFLLGLRIPVRLLNDSNGLQNLALPDATVQLTTNAIVVILSDNRDQTGQYRVTWELKEWN